MFHRIKKRFGKEWKVKADAVTTDEKGKELDDLLKEIAARREELRAEGGVLKTRLSDADGYYASRAKNLGVTFKFMGVHTGVIHEVQPDDRETYDKLFRDENMKQVF